MTIARVGNYAIAVTYGGQPITGSPFTRAVGPAFDEKAVLVSGDSLKLGSPAGAGVPAGVPQTLTVDTREAGDSELEVSVIVCIIVLMPSCSTLVYEYVRAQ